MSKKFWALIIVVILVFGGAYYWIVSSSPRVNSDKEYLDKIEILITKVDSIKRANDSIRIIIDTTNVEITNTYNEYVEIRDRITVQSPDSDCIFFSNYLSENSRRFIDTINFEAVKGN